jgi:hypothetical protein
MIDPADRLTTQSTSADETQTDQSVVTPREAAAAPGGNADLQDAAPDQAETRPPAKNSSSNEEDSQSGWLTSNLPKAGFTPVLELVRRPSDRQINVALFTLRDKKAFHVSYDTQIQHNGRSHRVPAMPPALSRSLILPTIAKGFKSDSDRDLVDSIVALLRNHVMLPEKQCLLLAHWSIATWFPDFLPFIPSLVITGPAAAADLLLRTLVAVCRRPLLLADASPAVLSALPLGELMPTLLMREPQLNKRMAALLDASSQPGYLLRGNKDFHQFYCAKCIYIGEHANNQLLTPNRIHIHAGGNSLRSLTPLPTDDVIQDFQNRLLFYRILRHDDVAASKFLAVRFRPEVCAIAQVLGASTGDLGLRSGIVELLKEHDEQSRVDRASGQHGTVLKAVLRHCHQPDQQQVFVREIAATANQIYSDDGESLKITNETVGHVLKNLGLYTRRLGNAGRGLVLDKATQARVHELSYANEVLTDSPEAPACGHCHKMEVQETQGVV